MTRTNREESESQKLHVKSHVSDTLNLVCTLRPWFKKAAVAFTAVVSQIANLSRGKVRSPHETMDY